MQIIGDRDTAQPQSIEVISSTDARVFGGRSDDPQEMIVDPGQCRGRYRRAEHHQFGLVDQRHRSYRHGAGHRPDDRLDLAFQQATDSLSGEIRVLLVVLDDQFDHPAVHTTAAVAHFDGQHRAIATGNSQVGHPTRETAEEAQAQWLRRRTASQRATNRKQGGDTLPPAWKRTLSSQGSILSTFVEKDTAALTTRFPPQADCLKSSRTLCRMSGLLSKKGANSRGAKGVLYPITSFRPEQSAGFAPVLPPGFHEYEHESSMISTDLRQRVR